MGKIIDATKVSKILGKLFTDAEKNGGKQYIYTLLRVTGIEGYEKEPLFQLHDSLKQIGKEIMDDEIPAAYQLMTGTGEPFNLIVNLINCTKGKPYDSFPFQHLYSGKIPNIIKPTIKEIAKETAKIARESAMKKLSELIVKAFPEQILDHFPFRDEASEIESLKDAFNTCKMMLSNLLEKYFAVLHKFKEFPKLYKLPYFEVLELLVNDKDALYGFKMHFSNGTSARFIRGVESTDCINIRPGVPIEFMVGPINELKHEWRIGEKRLYEVGLPGRYNELGGWKPLIYPGESSPLEQEAIGMSDDPDVSGSIFYMMCTGHRVIEFVVRTSIEMPLENFTFGKKLHFFKCPSSEDIPNTHQNINWSPLLT